MLLIIDVEVAFALDDGAQHVWEIPLRFRQLLVNLDHFSHIELVQVISLAVTDIIDELALLTGCEIDGVQPESLVRCTLWSTTCIFKLLVDMELSILVN